MVSVRRNKQGESSGLELVSLSLVVWCLALGRSGQGYSRPGCESLIREVIGAPLVCIGKVNSQKESEG